VVDALLASGPVLAYLVIGGLVFAEAALFVGFVLPGETAAFLGGVLAATHQLALAGVLVLVVSAAVAGDTVGYELGRHAGPKLLGSRALRGQAYRLDGARAFLRRRGGAAVFLARFTAFLRAVMPALAGLSRMPYGRFLAFNAAGALVWGAGVTLLGFFAGASYRQVERWLGRGSALLLALVALAGAGAWWWRRRRRSRGA
jgi:membrane protein DedA with SNARE-associated domain